MWPESYGVMPQTYSRKSGLPRSSSEVGSGSSRRVRVSKTEMPFVV
jgi:hypothetical protein